MAGSVFEDRWSDLRGECASRLSDYCYLLFSRQSPAQDAYKHRPTNHQGSTCVHLPVLRTVSLTGTPFLLSHTVLFSDKPDWSPAGLFLRASFANSVSTHMLCNRLHLAERYSYNDPVHEYNVSSPSPRCRCASHAGFHHNTFD